MSNPLFPLGQVVMTRAVSNLKVINQLDIFKAIARHRKGDWGEIDKEDALLNEASLKTGDRLMSVYTINNVKLWIIT